MSKIFLVDLESVSTRYTGQWKTHLPQLLRAEGHQVSVIEGPTNIPTATTPGAFLNFGGTNIYKADQIRQIAELFTHGQVPADSHFVFTDAWHPGIINLKYMSALLAVPVTIHALWHAGSYDPEDFLGRLIGRADWVRSAEHSFFSAADYNYFATDFHVKLFRETFMEPEYRFHRTGWPMEYMEEELKPFQGLPKRDIIVFPHRIAPEKQVNIFRDLAQALPKYKFVVAQDRTLTKQEYHELLAGAKMVFSASLQETLGIGCYEGSLLGAMPIVPDRLSYREMYDSEFKYPSEWTSSWNNYKKNKDKLVEHIRWKMENYSALTSEIKAQAQTLTLDFFSAKLLLENLK